ncbi:MAG TPA: FlgD immunoglobulin-like domain containing protein [Bacteroidota bacterium]|nr:FlgD immunoglobulin-like domain containing protein [Bacteroidota bacterium]
MKRFLLGCALAVAMIFVVVAPVFSQVQTAKIKIVAVPDRYKAGNKNVSTSGLKTVGLNTRVVLAPFVMSGTGLLQTDTLLTATGATWSVKNPFGVTKLVSDTAVGLNGKVVYFVPDTVGDWTVSMVATTSKGSAAQVTSTITVAKFVGAGISLTSNQSVPMGCACHLQDPTNFQQWSQTNHAVAIKIRGNDPTGHFSFSCFSCHAIGFETGTAVGNNGFFDVAKAEGLTTFPKNGPGAFDTLTTKYPKSMGMTGIQCENCHGPAGQHIASYPQHGNNKLDESLSPDVCAPCHFSSDRHGIGYAWTGSAHAISTSEGVQTQFTDRPVCARCHTAQGYINEVIGGQAQPVPATNALVYANPMAIGCAACHDPHNGSNEMQLRAKTVGDACIGCHITRQSSRGLHTAHQGSMLIGANTTPFSLSVVNAYLYAPSGSVQQNNAAVGTWGGWEFPGYTYENSSHSDIKERCALCHMASSPTYLAASASNFTVADTMITKLGGHTFKVAYDNITSKDTTTILNPTGCAECHGKVSIDLVESTQSKTQNLLNTLYALLPKRDSTISATAPQGTAALFTDTVWMQNNSKVPAASKRRLTTVERAAAYNYQFVTNDGSGGVHNFNYAKGLLTSSIEQMKLTNGAASIGTIKDVPGDNGKKVQVTWGQFPAETYTSSPVVNYGIWRKDPVLPSLNSIKKVGSFTELMTTTGQGGQAVMGGSVWTYVGSVPASAMGQYSYIAATLFDSTKVSGQRWTVFYIAGYTKDNQTMYSTQPDSGYSVDNLAPSIPAGLSASFATNLVTLKWTANVESDVYQYAIYRGTTANFNPVGTTPVAKVRTPLYQDPVSQSSVTYYYKVSAIDISGNESGYASVSVVTDVETGKGVPTEFALDQNFPNPFNPTTEIAFSVPKQTPVKVVIYGLSGEVVATIVNQTMSAGNYRVTWNGRTDDGRAVASGVYFYHLQADGFVSTKKMTLLK